MRKIGCKNMLFSPFGTNQTITNLILHDFAVFFLAFSRFFHGFIIFPNPEGPPSIFQA